MIVLAHTYAVGFGILDNGETAMVEWTDGYSLESVLRSGRKDNDSDLWIARWEEVMMLPIEDVSE